MFRFIILSLSIFAVLTACDKNNHLSTDQDSTIKVSFSYINPQEKSFSDSSIRLPADGFAIELGRPVAHYLGALFKNTSTLTTSMGTVPAVRDYYAFKWELRDAETAALLKTGDNFDYTLDIQYSGQYQLGLYAYDTRTDPSMTKPIDSAQKTLIVSDRKKLKQVSIDTLVLTAPYYLNLPQDATVDVFMRVYASREDQLEGKNYLYQSTPICNQKSGATNLLLPVDTTLTIPSYVNENEQTYIQLYFEHGGKIYPSIDNASPGVFKHYQTGFLSTDKSYLVEERILRLNGMRMEVISGFDFMQAD